MVFVKKIYLEDPIPSACQLNIAVRKVIYSIVGAVVANSDGYVEEEPEVADISEIAELELPVSFGKPSQPFKRKRAGAGKHCGTKKVKLDPDFMTVWKSEHNLYACYCKSDGLYYPVRVVGVGPTAPPGSHSMVYFLGYGHYEEVDRSECLMAMPIEMEEQANLSIASEGGDAQRSLDMHYKYWDQRYRLFSRHDHGIEVPDEESWFSVTPEVIGKHIADKLRALLCPSAVILDCFSGCGGNAIHLAKYFTVIASDIDPSKISALRKNAAVYNVDRRMECVVSDAFHLLRAGTEGDANRYRLGKLVVLAPPWGGIDYADKGKRFDLHVMFPFGDCFPLIELSLRMCANVILILPKTTHKKQFEEIASTFSVVCNVEDIFLWGKCKMTVAYIGPIFRSSTVTAAKQQG